MDRRHVDRSAIERPSLCICGAEFVEATADGLWRVSWLMVNPIAHPQFYVGERVAPGITADLVPEECWRPVSKDHDREASALSQMHGLEVLIADGELIRDVKLERAAAPSFVEVGNEDG